MNHLLDLTYNEKSKASRVEDLVSSVVEPYPACAGLWGAYIYTEAWEFLEFRLLAQAHTGRRDEIKIQFLDFQAFGHSAVAITSHKISKLGSGRQ